MNEWNLAQYPSQQGKVAIITGANRGIVTRQLAPKKAQVGELQSPSTQSPAYPRSPRNSRYPHSSPRASPVDC